MYPTLLRLGELRFHSYVVMFALAFLVGAILPVRENLKRETPFPITTLGGIWAFFGGVFGAKLWWVIQYGAWEDWRWFQFLWTGGLVFFGGLLGGVLACLLYLRLVRAPLVMVSDLVIPYVALAHGIARVGCFLNGCCYGASTSLPWGVAYPRHRGPFSDQLSAGLIDAHAGHSLPVHPTQIYETIGLVFLFFLLRAAYKRPHRDGSVVALYLTGYGLLRFCNEFLRGDSAHPVAVFTASQLVAGGLVLAGIVWLLVLRRGVGKGKGETVTSG